VRYFTQKMAGFIVKIYDLSNLIKYFFAENFAKNSHKKCIFLKQTKAP
jgi:hypothetical protein